MPIVSHTIEESVQANGGKNYTVRFYDQDSKSYTQAFYAPVGFDIDSWILNKTAELDEWLAQAEFDALVGAG